MFQIPLKPLRPGSRATELGSDARGKLPPARNTGVLPEHPRPKASWAAVQSCSNIGWCMMITRSVCHGETATLTAGTNQPRLTAPASSRLRDRKVQGNKLHSSDTGDNGLFNGCSEFYHKFPQYGDFQLQNFVFLEQYIYINFRPEFFSERTFFRG